MRLENQVLEDLNRLGDNDDEIATNLAAKRIKGRWTSAQECPIAKYLDQLGYGNPGVGVMLAFVDLPWSSAGMRIKIELPDPIRHFVATGDANGKTRWPHLTETQP